MKIFIIFCLIFSLIQAIPIDYIDEYWQNIANNNVEQNQQQENPNEMFSNSNENLTSVTESPTSSFDSEYIKQILNITSCGLRLNNDNNFNSNETFDSYIVGGKQAAPNSWPWMVGIYRREKFLCGGTIINSQYILTAAHCVSRGGHIIPKEHLKVLIGAHKILPINSAAIVDSFINNTSNIEENKISENEFQGILIPVEKVIPHENYTLVYMQNDIAILKLNQSLSFDQQKPQNNKNNETKMASIHQPICLPNNKIDAKNFFGLNSTIIGWGHQHEGGFIASILNEVQVPIISNEQCLKIYGDKHIRNKQICAAHPNGGKDSCQGDSGGPLIIADEDDNDKLEIYYQLGIVSWGRGCARPKIPGVYTRVSKYVDWILQQIQSNYSNNNNNGSISTSC